MSDYNPNYLDFEKPLLEIDNKIKAIKTSASASQKDINKIESLNKELEKNISKIFSSLSDWQISQIARHPLRPYTLDYISNMFTNFIEIHGDRMFGDDKAIICGLAKLDGRSILLIGHQKGRDSKDKVFKSLRNLPNVKTTDINHFSAFDIIKFKKVIFTETSVKELEKRYE